MLSLGICRWHVARNDPRCEIGALTPDALGRSGGLCGVSTLVVHPILIPVPVAVHVHRPSLTTRSLLFSTSTSQPTDAPCPPRFPRSIPRRHTRVHLAFFEELSLCVARGGAFLLFLSRHHPARVPYFSLHLAVCTPLFRLRSLNSSGDNDAAVAMAAKWTKEPVLSGTDGTVDKDVFDDSEGPTFHAPVVFYLPENNASVGAVAQRLAQPAEPGLGPVVVGPPAGYRSGPAHFEWGPPASHTGLDALDGDGDEDGFSDTPGAGVPASLGSARRKAPARTRQPRVVDEAADSAVGTGDPWDNDPEPVTHGFGSHRATPRTAQPTHNQGPELFLNGWEASCMTPSCGCQAVESSCAHAF